MQHGPDRGTRLGRTDRSLGGPTGGEQKLSAALGPPVSMLPATTDKSGAVPGLRTDSSTAPERHQRFPCRMVTSFATKASVHSLRLNDVNVNGAVNRCRAIAFVRANSRNPSGP